MSPDESGISLSWLLDHVWIAASGLVVWAWKRNESEHQMIRADHTKLQDNTSKGHSILNDRVMDHIDKQVNDVRTFVIQEDAKLLAELSVQRGHIGKVFDKMEAHAQRSEDRHIEATALIHESHQQTMAAIHALANTMHTALAGKADK